MRWRRRLSEFEFDVVDHAGVGHQAAYALLRLRIDGAMMTDLGSDLSVCNFECSRGKDGRIRYRQKCTKCGNIQVTVMIQTKIKIIAEGEVTVCSSRRPSLHAFEDQQASEVGGLKMEIFTREQLKDACCRKMKTQVGLNRFDSHIVWNLIIGCASRTDGSLQKVVPVSRKMRIVYAWHHLQVTRHPR